MLSAIRSITARRTPVLSRATFSTTARALGAGDVGAPPKTGGLGDAFQRRERASEEMAIRKREKEKLMELKKRIHEQQKHLETLSDHIDELTRERDAHDGQSQDQQK